ncbi:MAG: PAS domain S-box protein, partial [Mariprofundaceae bacterium]
MKSNLKLKHILMMSSLVVILAVLYVLSSLTDLTGLHIVRAKANLIASIDSSMERDMVNLSVGRLFHYDSLSLGMRRTSKLVAEIQKVLPDDEAVQTQLGKLLQSIDAQKPPLQEFMRGNAVLQNSLRYITSFIHKTSHDKPELEEFLIHLHRDILRIVILKDLENIDHIQPYVEQLKNEGFAGFAKHVQMIMKYYPRNNEAMEAFEHCGVQENAAAVADAYDVWADGELEKQRLYQLLLIIFSLGLIAYIGWVLYRMNRLSMSLLLSNRELKYQKIAMDEHANVSITDRDGVITYVNDRFCQLSGYHQDELIGKNHRIIKSGLHPDRFYAEMWETIEAGKIWTGEIINRCKDGGLFYVNSTIVPFLDEQGESYQFVAIRSDISPLKQAAAKLKNSRERYRGLIEDMPMPVGVHKDDKWIFMNPAMVEMFVAKNADALIGANVFERVHPDEKDAVIERFRNTVMKGVKAPPLEERLLRMNGKSFSAEVQGMLMEWSGTEAVLVTVRDITERKQMEEEKAEYRLKIEHTQRLESLGVLAGGIAHDFNNLLTAILGNAALAAKFAKDDARMSKYLHRISAASKSAAEL